MYVFSSHLKLGAGYHICFSGHLQLGAGYHICFSGHLKLGAGYHMFFRPLKVRSWLSYVFPAT